MPNDRDGWRDADQPQRISQVQRRVVVAASAVYAGLLSTWTVAGLLTLALAWLADQAIEPGTYETSSGAFRAATRTLFHPAQGSVFQSIFTFGARLGLAPVAATVAACVAVWLYRRQRREAASAAATVAVVVLAFNARQFTTIDLIGWRTAVAATVVAGRTTATTAVTLLLAFVLDREDLVPRATAIVAAVGFPLVIGLSRVSLGVHGALEVLTQWGIGAGIAAGIGWAYVLTAQPVRARR